MRGLDCDSLILLPPEKRRFRTVVCTARANLGYQSLAVCSKRSVDQDRRAFESRRAKEHLEEVEMGRNAKRRKQSERDEAGVRQRI